MFSSGRPTDLNEKWNVLESREDLENAMEESTTQRVVIFKHSTRCHISKTVLRNFQKEMEEEEKNASFYYLDLLAHRDLSNQIAQDLGVRHESPQLLVVENKALVKEASHSAISLSLV